MSIVPGLTGCRTEFGEERCKLFAEELSADAGVGGGKAEGVRARSLRCGSSACWLWTAVGESLETPVSRVVALVAGVLSR